MFNPSICYVLVGPPGCGKSTLAERTIEHNPAYKVVSTDRIREKLYGDASIQGDWATIEQEVFLQIEQSLAAGHPVIYDATNFKRPQRIALLQKLARHQNVYWVAWHLQTPLKICLARNQQRSRIVPVEAILLMHRWLENFPPIPAEGFAAVYDVPVTDGTFEIEKFTPTAQKPARIITNRENRNKNNTLHRYSRLLDFERLMHLMALIICYPGVGNLQKADPNTLKSILGTEAKFTSATDEVCALMSKIYDPLYAHPAQIADDLAFLETNGLTNSSAQVDAEIVVPEYKGDAKTFGCHTYSDLDLFARLFKTIRIIAHYPFLRLREEQRSLDMLLEVLQAHKVYTCNTILRNDIRFALKPYKILPETPMRRGYFISTAILAKHELKEVFKVLQSQAESLEDPAAVGIYQVFKERMEESNLLGKSEVADIYPVRAIGNQAIVDIDSLPDYAVYKKIKDLEEAIEKGEQLELDRIAGTGRFENDPHGNEYFRAYPLQLIFHNIGWYLGYECVSGQAKNLFRFERLDRIFLCRSMGVFRNRNEQKKSLQKLEILYKSGGLGIFLGNSAEEQKKLLMDDKSVKTTVEVWCTARIFKFIAEGRKRFLPNQMKMSKPLVSSEHKLKSSMFSLEPSDDPTFPHRFQVTLPKWSLYDVDLKRWLIGFGGQVKVVEPPELVEEIKKFARELMSVYED